MYKDLKRTCTAIVLLPLNFLFGDVLVVVVVVVCLSSFKSCPRLENPLKSLNAHIKWPILLARKHNRSETRMIKMPAIIPGITAVNMVLLMVGLI